MNLLLCGTSFDPSYGGPAASVSRLGAALTERGISVSLWAPDGSAKTSSVISDTPGLRRAAGALRDVIALGPRPDLIHDNGLWLAHNHAIARLAHRLGVPRVVTLRGMLEPWALNHRRWKKRAAWYAYQRWDLEAADVLHATAENEAENARSLGLTRPTLVVPNGVDFVMESELHSGSAASTIRTTNASRPVRRALFLSRVHPKKGIEMLLGAWASRRPDGWELVIAGPAEDGHDTAMRRLADALGIGSVVTFVGPVYGSDKSALFRSVDLFVLPTHSENFGIVVAEALAHQVPVVTTTGAPWQLLESERCGWWVAPTAAGIREGLEAALALTDGERRAMGQRGRLAVEARFAWERVAEAVDKLIYAPLLVDKAIQPPLRTSPRSNSE